MKSSFETFNPDSLDSFGIHAIERASNGILYQMQRSGIIGRLQAQFDIKIENNIDRPAFGSFQPPVTIELFNYINSFANSYNPALNPPYVPTAQTPAGFDLRKKPVNPIDTNKKIEDVISYIVAATPFTLYSNYFTSNGIYFDSEGNLIVQSYVTDPLNPIAFTQSGKVKISCRQCSYYSLLKSSAINPFIIEKIRMFYSNGNDPNNPHPIGRPGPQRQLDEDLNFIKKTFLGAVSENRISPRSYLRPTQYQAFIIDIPIERRIDGERGIWYTIHSPDINNNERVITVVMSMTLSRYYKHELKTLQKDEK